MTRNIKQDRKGNILIASFGGVYRYDGKSLPTGQAGFRNFMMNEGLPGLPDIEVNSIIEDKEGNFWFGTRGNAYIYDGKTFAVLTHNGKPFWNVRTMIEDKKGNIWLAGGSGLWRYDGKTFTNFTRNAVGYVYEDKKGNIWTPSQSANDLRRALSRYDEKSLSNKKPIVTDIMSKDEQQIRGAIFGILEANYGSIWFGASSGLYRYDGNTITRL